MKRNVSELATLPRLATRVGASEIIVSNLVPHTAEMEQEVLYSRSLGSCAYRASRWVANVSLPKMDVDDKTVGPLRRLFSSTASIGLLDASLSGRNDYCRFVRDGYAAVRWDGSVSPCLPLLYDHPLYVLGRRKDVSHYSLGNIATQSLPDVWASQEYVDFRQRLRNFPFSPCTTCGGCDRFAENLIDCTDNTFPVCGGCLWAQGFVQCP
jgi:MoaA/NifB/PqqE/SkfB family radical SAM enzyme